MLKSDNSIDSRVQWIEVVILKMLQSKLNLSFIGSSY